LIEIPAAGENAIRLLAQLGGLSVEPLLEKYRRFSNAKLTSDEQIVIIQGGASPGPAAGPTSAGAAGARTDRSSKYDAYLETHAKDLSGNVTKRVLPRERAAQLMKKLKEDSKGEQDLLDRIQAEKLKFAEALFDPAESSAPGESPDAKKK
jgi:hypothetical protein